MASHSIEERRRNVTREIPDAKLAELWCEIYRGICDAHARFATPSKEYAIRTDLAFDVMIDKLASLHFEES